ncbi:phospholipase A2 inhibitor gamma subunit B-like [Clupea harengus]|uniref:Phospholipase A2 inhibitor gamma subunit B-like n=1 Tax=Clupea harengus TaxID=7950 RepID=A0A6P8FI42_CLUHA|nr:phospholipase A2 inhibitor gamma subunit B-like [Clupea harengus]
MFNLLLFAICTTFAVGQTPEECYECSGETWESCAGVNHTCRISEKCVSAASAFTQELAGIRKDSIEKVHRRCADTTLCETDFSVNFGPASWNIMTKCGANPTLGNEKKYKNGLKCFGCISSPSECTKTLECKETETMCISASETVAGNIMVNRGCATEAMCELREDISDVVGPVVVGQVSCCKGNLCNGSGILKSTSSVCLLLVVILPWMLP